MLIMPFPAKILRTLTLRDDSDLRALLLSLHKSRRDNANSRLTREPTVSWTGGVRVKSTNRANYTGTRCAGKSVSLSLSLSERNVDMKNGRPGTPACARGARHDGHNK